MAPELTIREATRDDLPAIVGMLADDPLGGQRENPATPLPDSYYNAFDAIQADPNNHLMVAVRDNAVIGTFQLTLVPSLSYQGGWRATIESVRTDASMRGQGVGTGMMRYAIDFARERGCVLLQLSTHKSRTDAHRFYGRLGFHAGHVGMKLMLND